MATNLFLDRNCEKTYDVAVSCKEFWFGTKTSRKALEAYAAFFINPALALAPYKKEDEGR